MKKLFVLLAFILCACVGNAQVDLDDEINDTQNTENNDEYDNDFNEVMKSEIVGVLDFESLGPIQHISADKSKFIVCYGNSNIAFVDKSGQEPQIATTITDITPKLTRIRAAVEKDGYLYVCSRGNGYGVHYEGTYPELFFPFEKGLTKFKKDLDNFDECKQVGNATMNETGEPSPARWQHSLAITKKEGNAVDNYAFIRKKWNMEGRQYISFWIKPGKETHSDIVKIPLVWKDDVPVLSFAYDEDNLVGLDIEGKTYWGYYVLNKDWNNIKVVIAGTTITLYSRGQEGGEWQKSLVRTGKITGNYFGVGLNTNSEDETVLVDELAYNPDNIENVMYKNGELTVIDLEDNKVVNNYQLNMRCLDLIVDGKYLYLGMIGGMNVYDISQPDNPKLVGINRDATRTWTYPTASMTANYHYSVNAEELQRMAIDEHDGVKYLVAGSDVGGVNLFDITNPEKPTFLKQISKVPKVSAMGNSANRSSVPQYIQWGVVMEYPYVYSTVASYQQFQHNDFFDGSYNLINKDDIVYGIMVSDISDIENVKSKIIRIDEDNYPTYVDADGDARPNMLVRQGDNLIGNLSDKGIMVFNINGMDTRYVGCRKMPNNGRVYALCATDDNQIAIGDFYKGNIWNERKMYVINLNEQYRRQQRYYSALNEAKKAKEEHEIEEGGSAFGAATKALEKYEFSNEQLAEMEDDDIENAVDILKNAALIANNNQEATQLILGRHFSDSYTASLPAGWTIACSNVNEDGDPTGFYANNGVFSARGSNDKSFDMTQTISCLPEGTYKITALCATTTEDGTARAAVYATAGSCKARTQEVVKKWDSEAREMSEYQCFVNLQDGQDLTIGVTTDAHSIYVSDFNIKYVPEDIPLVVASQMRYDFYDRQYDDVCEFDADDEKYAEASKVVLYPYRNKIVTTNNPDKVILNHNLVIDGVCNGLVLNDACPWYVSQATGHFITNEVDFMRRMDDEERWGTLILPFDAKSNDDVQFFALNQVVNKGQYQLLRFEPVETVKKNTPVVFKRLNESNIITIKGEASEFDVTEQDIFETDTDSELWKLYGVYNSSESQFNEYAYNFQENAIVNDFQSFKDYVKPMRAFFVVGQPIDVEKIVPVDGVSDNLLLKYIDIQQRVVEAQQQYETTTDEFGDYVYEGAATAALQQYDIPIEDIPFTDDDDVNKAIAVLANAKEISENAQSLKTIVGNIALDMLDDNGIPADWELQVNATEPKMTKQDDWFAVEAKKLTSIDLSQILTDLPLGTYRLSAKCATNISNGKSKVAIYAETDQLGARSNEVIDIIGNAEDQNIYDCFIELTPIDTVKIGVITEARKFNIKDLNMEFVPSNEVETDASYLRYDYHKQNAADFMEFNAVKDKYANAKDVVVYPNVANQVIRAANTQQFRQKHNIIIDNVCDSLVFKDNASLAIYKNSAGYNAKKASLVRNMKYDSCGTLILPWKLRSNDSIAYFKLIDVDLQNNKMKFELMPDVEPNTPVFFKILNDSETANFIGEECVVQSTLNPQNDDAVECEGWRLMGFYKFQTLNKEQLANMMYVINDKAQSMANCDSYQVKPFYAYIQSDYNIVDSFDLFNNDEPDDNTPIENVILNLNTSADIYSTQGVLVRKNATNTKGLDKGVYVVNNKKILVR